MVRRGFADDAGMMAPELLRKRIDHHLEALSACAEEVREPTVRAIVEAMIHLVDRVQKPEIVKHPAWTERHELAYRHVIDGREIVERQHALVRRQAALGHDTTKSKELLEAFRQSQAIFEADLIRIERDQKHRAAAKARTAR